MVDGNVYRVLARVFGITDDITTTGARKTFAALAHELIQPAADPATYNQAIMEFGAIQCTPVSPDCLLCPLQQACVAFQTGRQQQLPVKARKAPVRERFFNYLVFRQGNRLALRERTGRDIWQNLHEFWLQETDEPADSLRALVLPEPVAQLVAQGRPAGPAVPAVQLLSHQRIRAMFHLIDLPEGWIGTLPDGLNWFSTAEINQLPKPVLITGYWSQLFG